MHYPYNKFYFNASEDITTLSYCNLYIQDATNVWEEMLARHCPKFSDIHDPGYDNRIIKSIIKSVEEYAAPDHNLCKVHIEQCKVSWFIFGFKLTHVPSMCIPCVLKIKKSF